MVTPINRLENPTGKSSIPSPEDLLPGGSSTAGFLENGQTLEQVLQRDREALKILGYTAQEVADLLGPICDPDRGYEFDHTAPNGKKYKVTVQTFRGMQECPWENQIIDWKRSPGASDIYLTEQGTNEKPVRIPGLLRHLIETHEFFEGGAYRVAPEKIVEMFGVEKIPGSIARAKTLTLK